VSVRTYRAAIVGAGAIGGTHAQAMGDLHNVELVAAVARRQDRARAFGERFGVAAYTDTAAMLEAERPDLVTIATPSGAHLEGAVAAIERGVAVLCEKPLEIDLERCDRMIDTAERHGVPLGGIFPQRFNPVVRVLREAAAAGRFGELAVVNAYVPWWREDTYYAPDRWQGTRALDGGGALMNQSIHGVDALQWIAGAAGAAGRQDANPVQEVFAYTARRGHDPELIEVEDTCVISLRFGGGALGQVLAATSMFPGTFKRLQVGGRGGTAEVLEDQLTVWSFRDALPEDDATRAQFGAATGHGGGASDPMAIDYSLHTANLAAFLAALDAGERQAISGHEARKAVAIIEAAYESARSGRPARVR
jgi:predicted dehydrogenase